MGDRIRRTYDIGDKVIFLKSGQECTVIGYHQQYNKLLNHKNRLLICPDSGLKRSKPLVAARPAADQKPIPDKHVKSWLSKETRPKVEAQVEVQVQPAVAEAPKEENVKPKRRRKKSVVSDLQEGNGAGTEVAKQ